MDTPGTASAYGLRLRPRMAGAEVAAAQTDFDSYQAEIVEAWMPPTLAVSSLNRSMGLPDLQPSVMSPLIVMKLGFEHELIRSAREAGNHTTKAETAVEPRLAAPQGPCDAQ